MIQNLCLICHNDSKEGVEDIHELSNEVLKTNLERILRRKICSTRFEEKQICAICVSLIEKLLNLEEELGKVVTELKGNFDELHPLKRGRKKKEEIREDLPIPEHVSNAEESSDGIRKSSRKRKLRDFEEFVDIDEPLPSSDTGSRILSKVTKIDKSEEILSSMATKCPYCDFAADSEAAIERHLRKTHSEDGKAFACEHCGKSFALKVNLDLHQKTHNLDKPFGCDKCDKTYKQRNSLREHVLKSHDNISKFMCSTCFEKFPSRHLLKSHERTHTGEQGHVCDDCGVAFGSKQALEHHMSKHNGQYNFVCPHCQKGYNCKTVFYEHTLTHSGDKPYTCQICNAKFSNRGTFWAHKKRHDNPKPYKCQVCSKSFTHSSHLAVHKRIHTGEKPYKCTFCTFSSASATNLKTHVKNHTNKLPFSCNQCNIGFKIKVDFMKHVETAHNGIIHNETEEDNNADNDTVANTNENPNDALQDTTVIQYIYQEPGEDGQGTEAPQYTIISDVSAYEHAQTVIEDTKTRILSTTQNEDGITLMVTTDGTGDGTEGIQDQNADQNIVYLEIPIEETDGSEETILVKQDNT